MKNTFSLFWIKVFQHYTRRGLQLTSMQQILIDLRSWFYTTGTFEQLIGVSVFATCTVIYKVSRAIATKRKEHVFCHSRRNWLIPRHSFMGWYREINRITVFLIILLFCDFYFFPADNFNIRTSFSSTSFSNFMTLQIVFFLGFEFQPPPASLQDLDHFPFHSVCILKVNFFATFYDRILLFLL